MNSGSDRGKLKGTNVKTPSGNSMTEHPALSAQKPVVLFVYGTRPEAIKVAPLIAEMSQRDSVEVRVAVTGQHREMLDQVHEVFGITPDVDLDLAKPGQTLTDITNAVLAGLPAAFDEYKPSAVVVHGDTTTTFAAALAAFYARIPVVHLEAGLRTGDMDSPFPEEGNRALTGRLAALHLSPTQSNRENLLAEGIDPALVTVTGNTGIDALLHMTERTETFVDPELQAAVDSGRPIVTVTTHRRESWGEPMKRIAQSIRELAVTEPKVLFVVPVHRNPVVGQTLRPVLADLPNVILTDPLPYPEFSLLMSKSTLAISDSGGVQEEAPSLGVPVLVTRESTERFEAIQAGTARLVGTDRGAIVLEARAILNDELEHQSMTQVSNPYGDGLAAGRCASAIEALVGCGTRDEDFVPVPGLTVAAASAQRVPHARQARRAS